MATWAIKMVYSRLRAHRGGDPNPEYEKNLTMSTSFCHLHVHSQYSILQSSLSIPAIANATREGDMAAVALTDHGNLYGAIDFYKAVKAVGVRPIIGCELNVADGSRFEKRKGATHSHLVVLAHNAQGYKNLCHLTSAGFLEGFYYVRANAL